MHDVKDKFSSYYGNTSPPTVGKFIIFGYAQPVNPSTQAIVIVLLLHSNYLQIWSMINSVVTLYIYCLNGSIFAIFGTIDDSCSHYCSVYLESMINFLRNLGIILLTFELSKYKH